MQITVTQGDDGQGITTDASAQRVSVFELHQCILAIIPTLGAMIDKANKGITTAGSSLATESGEVDYYNITPTGYTVLAAKLRHFCTMSDAAHLTAKRLSQIPMDHEMAASLRDALKSQLNIIDSFFPLIRQPAAEAAPTEEG